jgi:anti-anti-sigma factor
MTSDTDGPTSRDGPRPGRVTIGHHARGIALVTLSGEHDISTHRAVAHALELGAARSNVVVDLSHCSFIDSTIIEGFIKTAETLRTRGEEVILVIPARQTGVARTAQLAGLAQLFELHETTDTAFSALERAIRSEELAS